MKLFLTHSKGARAVVTSRAVMEGTCLPHSPNFLDSKFELASVCLSVRSELGSEGIPFLGRSTFPSGLRKKRQQPGVPDSGCAINRDATNSLNMVNITSLQQISAHNSYETT